MSNYEFGLILIVGTQMFQSHRIRILIYLIKIIIHHRILIILISKKIYIIF